MICMKGEHAKMNDLISRKELCEYALNQKDKSITPNDIMRFPSAQSEDYTELKREFTRMASYIDVLLECSDEQKETLVGFISRLSEYMPWTERD